MEQFRDTSKSAKQAKPVQDVIAGLNQVPYVPIHDHMHWENGVLVDDPYPDDGEEQMRLAKEANRILANYKGGFDVTGEYHYPEPVPSVDGRDLGGVALGGRWDDCGNYMDYGDL